MQNSLLADFKDKFIVLIFILTILLIVRFLFLYIDYSRFKDINFYYSDAQVVNIYKKRRSNLLKLKSNNLTFFIYSNYKAKVAEWVWVRYDTRRMSFIDYLRGYFTKGEVLEHIEYGFDRTKFLREYINSIHKNSDIASFYNAIFFAQPLNRALREKINSLGISHLVAISGFHLSVLWSVIFAILSLPYKFFQKRYFPWRSSIIDLSVIALVLLAIYTLFIGAPPALIRSYFMLLIVGVFIFLGLKIINFELLLIAFLAILIIFPKLILSLSFWLSIAGVYYIFLIIRYFGDLRAWIVTIFLVPFGLFIFMYPLSHLFFGEVNYYQLLSPILSLAFVIFYPLILLLHILGFGNIFDTRLEWLFSLPNSSANYKINIWIGAFYILLSLSALKSKRLFWLAFVFATILTLTLFFR